MCIRPLFTNPVTYDVFVYLFTAKNSLVVHLLYCSGLTTEPQVIAVEGAVIIHQIKDSECYEILTAL